MKLCTAINCMDGRVQLPVISYLKKKLCAEFVDLVTEAGPTGILSCRSNAALVQSIFDRVDISVNHHGSGAIAVVGHCDCAGNPGDRTHQIADIQRAVWHVRERHKNVPVVGLFVDMNWEVSEIADSP